MPSDRIDESSRRFGVFRLESYATGARDFKDEARWRPYGQEALFSEAVRKTALPVKDLLNPDDPLPPPQTISEIHQGLTLDQVVPPRVLVPYPVGTADQISCEKRRR